jgi:hypothetical protein
MRLNLGEFLLSRVFRSLFLETTLFEFWMLWTMLDYVGVSRVCFFFFCLEIFWENPRSRAIVQLVFRTFWFDFVSFGVGFSVWLLREEEKCKKISLI